MPPDDFEPMLPVEWGQAHPGVLARDVLADHEIAALCLALLGFGPPQAEDWSQIRALAGLTLVDVDAVRAVGEELLRAAESGAEDVSEFPLLAPARELVTNKELRRLTTVAHEMAEIREFVGNMDSHVTELLRTVGVRGPAPDWWSWECDRALLFAVNEYGRSKVAPWALDATKPFRKHFPKACRLALEQAAEHVDSRPRKLKVAVPDDTQCLFRESWRISRCLSVVHAVNKVMQKDRNAEASVKKRRSKTATQVAVNGDFPVAVGHGTVLVSPGRFILNDPRYDTKHAPYPVGFCLERVYRVSDWPRSLKFRAEIKEGENGPCFVVACLTEPVEVFRARDPSDVWHQAIAAARKRFGQPELPDDEPKKKSIGRILFGLYNKKVLEELVKLENARAMAGLQRAMEPIVPVTQPFEIRLPRYVPSEWQ
jgi:hypothetical protein